MSKFKPWIENNLIETGVNCQTLENYENDSQRRNGFKGGTAASAIRVNSGLRQANLVACALMEVVGDTTNDLTSSVDNVKNSINNYLNTRDVKDNITSFTEAKERSNLTSGEKLSISLGKISKYFSDMKALAYKDSVGTDDIDNQSITTNKLASGATIDNAFNATKINNLQIALDENGILKYNSIVIPQRKLIWSGNIEVKSTGNPIIITDEIKEGDILEVIYTCHNESSRSIKLKISYSSDPDKCNFYINSFDFRAVDSTTHRYSSMELVTGILSTGKLGLGVNRRASYYVKIADDYSKYSNITSKTDIDGTIIFTIKKVYKIIE